MRADTTPVTTVVVQPQRGGEAMQWPATFHLASPLFQHYSFNDSTRMIIMKKTYLKTALAIAVIGALPTAASAGLLTIRITDSNSGTSFVCADNTACDDNSAPNVVSVNATMANLALGSSLYDINGLNAASNFTGGDPLASLITSSGGLQSKATAPGATPLIIEISQTDWTKPLDMLRTLFQGPTTIFTKTGLGDFALFHALNDSANLLFAGNPAFDPPNTNSAGLPAGAADDFVTPGIQFNAGVVANGCGIVAGDIQTCASSSLLSGIIEGNPYSMTQRMVFELSDSLVPNALNRVDFSDSISKFSSPTQVPEPASMLLVGAGLFGAWVVRRKKAGQ